MLKLTISRFQKEETEHELTPERTQMCSHPTSPSLLLNPSLFTFLDLALSLAPFCVSRCLAHAGIFCSTFFSQSRTQPRSTRQSRDKLSGAHFMPPPRRSTAMSADTCMTVKSCHMCLHSRRQR